MRFGRRMQQALRFRMVSVTQFQLFPPSGIYLSQERVTYRVYSKDFHVNRNFVFAFEISTVPCKCTLLLSEKTNSCYVHVYIPNMHGQYHCENGLGEWGEFTGDKGL